MSPLPCGGVRGWVSLKVSKSPASLKNATSSLRALQRNAWQSTTKNATNDSSVADFAKADIANADSSVANFASAKSTHPHPTGCEALAEAKPPRAKGGGFKKHCHSFKGGGF
ncbi:hypothetical protein [Helicobacter sp. T3_23-1059]